MHLPAVATPDMANHAKANLILLPKLSTDMRKMAANGNAHRRRAGLKSGRETV